MSGQGRASHSESGARFFLRCFTLSFATSVVASPTAHRAFLVEGSRTRWKNRRRVNRPGKRKSRPPNRRPRSLSSTLSTKLSFSCSALRRKRLVELIYICHLMLRRESYACPALVYHKKVAELWAIDAPKRTDDVQQKPSTDGVNNFFFLEDASSLLSPAISQRAINTTIIVTDGKKSVGGVGLASAVHYPEQRTRRLPNKRPPFRRITPSN